MKIKNEEVAIHIINNGFAPSCEIRNFDGGKLHGGRPLIFHSHKPYKTSLYAVKKK